MNHLLLPFWRELISVNHIGWYFAIGYLIYVAILSVTIILQKREPVATLSWLMGLSLLPYLGLVIYYFLGPMRINRQRVDRERARANFRQNAVSGMDERELELARLIQATTGLPPASASKADLLIDGAAKYTSLLQDIALAKKHIHMEYYIFQPDATGVSILNALVKRARAGVEVRLLIDAVGSSQLKRKTLQPLLDAGGEVAWFHPTRWLKFWQRSWMNLRTHRKIVVIDDTVGYVGGINITDEEDECITPTAFRDLDVRLEGNVVRSLQLIFVEDWAYATHSKAEVLPHPPAVSGDITAQIVSSGPDSSWEAIHRAYITAIYNARERIWLMTPYFVPGEAARMALTSAALSGLDVRLMVPKMSDSKLVTLAARSYFGELLKAGVKIYEYGPRLLHTKAILCDDRVVMIGSANFDQRSFRLNFEVMALFDDTKIGADVEALFNHELESAPQVAYDLKAKRSMFRSRLPEAIARLLSPLL